MEKGFCLQFNSQGFCLCKSPMINDSFLDVQKSQALDVFSHFFSYIQSAYPYIVIYRMFYYCAPHHKVQIYFFEKKGGEIGTLTFFEKTYRSLNKLQTSINQDFVNFSN